MGKLSLKVTLRNTWAFFTLCSPPLSTLKRCQITTNKTTNQIVVKSYTMLEESDDKELCVPNKNTLGSPTLSVNQLNTVGEYDRATLRITTLKVKEPMRVSSGKQKQEVVVADDTGNTNAHSLGAGHRNDYRKQIISA